MEKRKFGRTGLDISVLTFGCGAVGGLMTKGAPADQERAVARALEAGVNHFDTAAAYGDGASEQNLGRVLASLKPDIILSTKVRVPAERPDIGAAIAASLDASLKRLKRDHVDVFQLHNTIGARADGATMSVDEVLGDVVPALNRAREQGKTRFIGFTAIGETEALHRADRVRRVRHRAGAVQRAQPERRRGDPGGLSGAGLWLHPRSRGGEGRRHHRHPRARGRRAVGTARSAIRSACRRSSRSARARTMRRTWRARKRLEPMVREGHASSLTEMAMRFVDRQSEAVDRRDRACEYRRARSGAERGGQGAAVGRGARAAQAVAGWISGEAR